MLVAITTSPAQADVPPADSAVNLFVTMLPLILLVGFWLVLRRYLREVKARAAESIALSREMVTELRAIRAALARESTPEQSRRQMP